MTNEIKEILEFKEDADYKRLSVDEIVILEDYISNLQDEIDIFREDALIMLHQFEEAQIIINKAIEYIEDIPANKYISTIKLLDILRGDE